MTVEISAAMQEYQDSRLERVKTIVKVGGGLTPSHPSAGVPRMVFLHRAAVDYAVDWLDTLAINIAKLCSAGTRLSFVGFAEQKGLLGWGDTVAEEARKERVAREKQQMMLSQTPLQKVWNWQGNLQQIWPLLVGLGLCLRSTPLICVAQRFRCKENANASSRTAFAPVMTVPEAGVGSTAREDTKLLKAEAG
ncbi:hypothetical protein BDW66DRAFT_150954 [Aspergillus desertorum]